MDALTCLTTELSKAMGTNFNPFGETTDGPIPPVNPEDLRSVWEMQRDSSSRVPRQAAVSVEFYKRACSHGADVGAVWYRVSQLGVLQMLGLLGPWIKDGVPTDAVFKVAAKIDLKRMQVGTVYNELPFDVQELFRQVEKET